MPPGGLLGLRLGRRLNLTRWRGTVRGPASLQDAHAHRCRHEHAASHAHLVEALRGGDESHRSAAQKMTDCCTYGIVAVEPLDPASAHWCPASCDQPLCPVCHDHRVRLTRRRLKHILDQPRYLGPDGRLRFVTLTLRRGWSAEGPRAAYEHASAALLKLRRRQAWGRHVVGGMAAYECNLRAGGWNPHWHVLTVGRWWKSNCRVCERHQRKGCEACAKGARRGHRRPFVRTCDPADPCISCEWLAVTGDSWSVDAQEKGGPAAIREVTKYVSKPLALTSDAVRLWASTMRRVRRFRWFGSWEGVDVPEDYTPRVLAPASQLYAVADEHGDAWVELTVHGGTYELQSLLTMAAGDLPPEAGVSPEAVARAGALQPAWVDGEPGPGEKRGTLRVVVDGGWARTAYAAVSRQADPVTPPPGPVDAGPLPF